jgi:hypothetical protein
VVGVVLDAVDGLELGWALGDVVGVVVLGALDGLELGWAGLGTARRRTRRRCA